MATKAIVNAAKLIPAFSTPLWTAVVVEVAPEMVALDAAVAALVAVPALLATDADEAADAALDVTAAALDEAVATEPVPVDIKMAVVAPAAAAAETQVPAMGLW